MKYIFFLIAIVCAFTADAQQIVSLGTDDLAKVKSGKSGEWVTISKNTVVYELILGVSSSSNALNYSTVVLKNDTLVVSDNVPYYTNGNDDMVLYSPIYILISSKEFPKYKKFLTFFYTANKRPECIKKIIFQTS